MKSFTDIDRKICPRCRSEAPFWIKGITERLLDGEENVLYEEFTWGPRSVCECDVCGFKGRVRDFQEKIERTEEERQEAIRTLLANLKKRHLHAFEEDESLICKPTGECS